ncbi:ankyrin repeat domain-containing protein [Streptacidiphilus sp. EB129]|uniref:ankyrin repeat domain-containing protein n=1 Tax=Streptacidiphilus sp. EB129 TaxID=3156262 RepID=UPI0035159D01
MNHIDAQDRQGRTPLHVAALNGDLAEVRSLLAAGADADLGDRSGFTPLHFAAQEYRSDVALALINAGADVNHVNVFGNTPLFVAVFNSRGRGDVIQLLRSCGANPLCENRSGQTPFGLARLIANYDVIQYFADLESPDSGSADR